MILWHLTWSKGKGGGWESSHLTTSMFPWYITTRLWSPPLPHDKLRLRDQTINMSQGDRDWMAQCSWASAISRDDTYTEESCWSIVGEVWVLCSYINLLLASVWGERRRHTLRVAKVVDNWRQHAICHTMVTQYDIDTWCGGAVGDRDKPWSKMDKAQRALYSQEDVEDCYKQRISI